MSDDLKPSYTICDMRRAIDDLERLAVRSIDELNAIEDAWHQEVLSSHGMTRRGRLVLI